MAWLLREGDVLATLEARRPGWTRTIQGAVVLDSPAIVHTFGCDGGLDLAWCSKETTDSGGPCLQVRRVACVAARRVVRPRLGSGAIVAGAPGAFERWRLQLGDRLEIRQGE